MELFKVRPSKHITATSCTRFLHLGQHFSNSARLFMGKRPFLFWDTSFLVRPKVLKQSCEYCFLERQVPLFSIPVSLLYLNSSYHIDWVPKHFLAVNNNPAWIFVSYVTRLISCSTGAASNLRPTMTESLWCSNSNWGRSRDTPNFLRRLINSE